MALNLLSPSHIDKLGNDIEEIRLRALRSIHSKFNLQLVDKDNVETSAILLKKLLNWFNYTSHSYDSQVIKLISNICDFPNIAAIVSDIGLDSILTSVSNIEKTVDASLLSELSHIKDRILQARVVSSKEQSVLEINIPPKKGNVPSINLSSQNTSSTEQNFQFTFQKLSKSDNDLLFSAYEGLRYVDDLSSIQQTCHLLTDVILRDFPAEIFIQRPLIFRTLLELSSKEDCRLFVLKCFLELTKALQLRKETYLDPEARGIQVNDVTEEPSMPIVHQMSLQNYCEIVLDKAFYFLSEETSPEESNILTELVLRLWTHYPQKNLTVFENCLMVQKDTNFFGYCALLAGYLEYEDTSLWMANEIQENILDPRFYFIYPDFHRFLTEKLKTFENFQRVWEVCESMDSAVKILKTGQNFIENMEKAYLSLDYHRNVDIFASFLKYCMKTDSVSHDDVSRIVIKYLCHHEVELRRTFYSKFHEVVAKFLGLDFYSERAAEKMEIFFHYNTWREILTTGLNSLDDEIKTKSEEILIYVLKSQLLLSPESWQKLIESFRPVWPILQAFADSVNVLGRIILQLFHPSSSAKYLIYPLPPEDLFKGNLRFLFCKNAKIREEAFVRICFLLSSDPNSVVKLPKISSIQGLRLSTICVVASPQSPVYYPTVFYGPCSLKDSLAVLKNPHSESRLRRTALSHLSAVLHDYTLFEDFFKEEGVELLLEMLDCSLRENEYLNYPDSVMPIIHILRNLAVMHPEAAEKYFVEPILDDLLKNIFRSMLLYCADESFRSDAASLIFMLLFTKQLKIINPVPQRKILISELILGKYEVPIIAEPLNEQIIFKTPEVLLKSKSFLRIYWASLWLGDFSMILELEPDDLNAYVKSSNLPDDLQLTENDVKELQNASYRFLKEKLMAIPFASSHDEVAFHLNSIKSYLQWIEVYYNLFGEKENFLIDTMPWDDVFEKFLTVIPACMEDEALLSEIILLLNKLLKVQATEKLLNWLTLIFTAESSICLELLSQGSNSEFGLKGRELQHRIVILGENLIYLTANSPINHLPWLQYVKVLLDYLHLNGGDNLYNIPHLDWLVSLLANITGAWKWDYSHHLNLYCGLIIRSMEILMLFYDADNSSFMGSNIVSNCLSILVHLISDIPQTTKKWELIWQQALMSVSLLPPEINYSWLLNLWTNRNPIIRANSVCLIAGFFSSISACELLVERLGLQLNQIWSLGFKMLLDNQERALVREKCGCLLTRLTALGARFASPEFLEYLKTMDFYAQVRTIILNFGNNEQSYSENAGYTKQLIYSLNAFLFTITCLNPPLVTQEIVKNGVFYALLSILSVSEEESDEETICLNTSSIKIIRTCLAVGEEALQCLKNCPEKLETIVRLLYTSGADEKVEELLPEVLDCLSLILSKYPGILSPIIRSETTLQEFIVKFLSSQNLLKPTLIFLNNLSTTTFSSFFNATSKSDCFGSLICEQFLHKDLLLVGDTWASILLICPAAQNLTLKYGLAETVLLQLKQIAVELNDHPSTDLKKSTTKRKLEPILLKIDCLFRFLVNLCFNNKTAQHCLANSGLANAVNKLWTWCNIRSPTMTNTLKLLCTYSYDSETAAQSLALSPSSGLRKSVASATLLHLVIQLVITEMNVLGKTHDAENLNLALQVLANCCLAVECRAIFVKSSLLASFQMFHPERDRKKHFGKFGEEILHSWIHFLGIFSSFCEGQLAVCKDVDTVEIILNAAAKSVNADTRLLSLSILVHAAMNHKNRIRLLGLPSHLMEILLQIIQSSTDKSELRLASAVTWALGANSQKAKVHLRNIGCENALNQALLNCRGDDDCSRTVQQALSVLKSK